VPIDLRTPKKAIDTLIKICNINNKEEFNMILDKKYYNPTTEEVSKFMKLINNSYVNIIRKEFSYDEEHGNINKITLKVVRKKDGKKNIIFVYLRNMDDLWYINNIKIKEKE
jgi:hypothetical protein